MVTFYNKIHLEFYFDNDAFIFISLENEQSCIYVKLSIWPLLQIVCWILELLRQCGIFLLDFGTILTVCYFSIGFWNCSDSVVFFYWILELFLQCGIFLLDFGTVLTVWYFSIGFWNCSDSVVFFYWILELF